MFSEILLDFKNFCFVSWLLVMKYFRLQGISIEIALSWHSMKWVTNLQLLHSVFSMELWMSRNSRPTILEAVFPVHLPLYITHIVTLKFAHRSWFTCENLSKSIVVKWILYDNDNRMHYVLFSNFLTKIDVFRLFKIYKIWIIKI